MKTDCEFSKLFCMWDEETSKCSLKTCALRDKDTCVPKETFTHNEELFTCYWDVLTNKCNDKASIP